MTLAYRLKAAAIMIIVVGLGIYYLTRLPNTGLLIALLLTAGVIAATPLLLPDRFISHINERLNHGEEQ